MNLLGLAARPDKKTAAWAKKVGCTKEIFSFSRVESIQSAGSDIKLKRFLDFPSTPTKATAPLDYTGIACAPSSDPRLLTIFFQT
ncbi:hypothetical protein DL767_002983 [Monosporascus sp. MG133]|nr:hypothetical protein DL767_002983 [Monosporascus sp. MG133]